MMTERERKLLVILATFCEDLGFKLDPSAPSHLAAINKALEQLKQVKSK